MKLHITDLMKTYVDNEFDLPDRGIADTERVKALTFAKIAALEEAPATPIRKRGLSRAARVILAVAAMIMALSMTAYGVYQARMADRVLEGVPVSVAADGSLITHYSPVGYDEAAPEPAGSLDIFRMRDKKGREGYSASGSNREYLALKDFTACLWSDDWGQTDDISGLPDFDEAIYYCYGIGNEPLQEKLRSVAEKYGLRLWQETAYTDSTEELFDILGMDQPFLPCGMDGWYTGHTVYDDGGFEAILEVELPGGGTVYVHVCRAVKGTLSDFFILGDGPETYDYETYAASGAAVDVALGESDSLVFAETEHCYVTMQVYAGREALSYADGSGREAITMDGLKALVDTVDFAALDDIDTDAVAAAVAAEHAEDVAENPDYYNYGERVEAWLAVYDSLGDYGLEPADLPEGYRFHGARSYTAEEGANTMWADLNGGCFEQVIKSYSNGSDAEMIYLNYTRYWADREQTTLFNSENFYGHLDYMGDAKDFIDFAVGGFDGYYRVGGEFEHCIHVTWYDTDKELIFDLTVPKSYTVADAMALAEDFAAGIG